MNISRFFARRFLFVFLALFVCFSVTVFAQAAEPAPWWKQVEEWQSTATKIITAVGVVAAILVATVAKIMADIRAVRERQDRQGEEKRELQKQVVDLALNIPAPKPNTNGGVPLGLLLACFSLLFLSACVTTVAPDGTKTTRFDGKTAREIGRGALTAAEWYQRFSRPADEQTLFDGKRIIEPARK